MKVTWTEAVLYSGSEGGPPKDFLLEREKAFPILQITTGLNIENDGALINGTYLRGLPHSSAPFNSCIASWAEATEENLTKP